MLQHNDIKSNIIEKRGRDDSYCSFSVECQERGHEMFIYYKAHA